MARMLTQVPLPLLPRDAAEIVLSDDNFASVVAGVEEGRIAYKNIRNVIAMPQPAQKQMPVRRVGPGRVMLATTVMETVAVPV